jgi:hypothetical protein
MGGALTAQLGGGLSGQWGRLVGSWPSGLVGGWQPPFSFNVLWHGEAFHGLGAQDAKVSALPCALPQPSVSPVSQQVPWFWSSRSLSLSQSPFSILVCAWSLWCLLRPFSPCFAKIIQTWNEFPVQESQLPNTSGSLPWGGGIHLPWGKRLLRTSPK